MPAQGCQDTDNNGGDFITGAPNPRNGLTTPIVCDFTPPPPPPPPPGLADPRFVELHYDNAGSDVNEALEIEGPAGFSLAGWSVVLYNGTGGAVYDTRPLTGTIPDMCDGRGVIALRFEPDGIQNGPDGFALVDAAGDVKEFFSYEGTFTPTNGPAFNRASPVNIGVAEPSNNPLGHSIRRDATGTWQAPAAGNSIGACNSGVGPAMPPYQNISFSGRTQDDIALPVGFQDQVFASIIDEKGVSVTTTITWTAETPGLASIDSRGVITALGAGISQFRATTAESFTRVLSLPTQIPIASTSAHYGNNAEFGEPADGNASDDFIVRRPQYTLSYNRNRGTPNWVSYDLDASHIGSFDRCDCFTFDPALPAEFPRYNTADYTGVREINGYAIDRGHLARSFDRTTGSLDNAFTFYFSNIVPQASDINQGPWAGLETYLGNLARNSDKEVYIVTGVAGEKGTVKNEGKITIPAKVWKVALILPHDKGLADVHTIEDLEVVSVIMPNDPIPPNPNPSQPDPLQNWETYKTTVDEVELISGYDLLAKLEDQIEILVESGDKAPIAVWGGETRGSEGSPVDFDASHSSDPDIGDALTFSWNFGDGTTGTGVKPVHVFADNGVYPVLLTVTDSHGATNTQSNSVTIENADPSVVIGTPPTIYSGQTYSFSGGFGDLGQNDDPWQYQINWGNGTGPLTSISSQGAITGSRQYLAAGNYDIGLTVTDKDGGSGSASATLRVLRLPTGLNVNPSIINTSGNGSGQVTITILGNSEFDGSMIRLSSIRIGSATPDADGNSESKANATDVNGDGILDLVVHFTRSGLIDGAALGPATTVLTLNAELNDGRQIEAKGGVNVRAAVEQNK